MIRAILVGLALALGGCGALPPTVAPTTFVERAAYTEAQAQGAIRTVAALTCTKGYDAKGLCLEAGKPLRPELALELLQTISRARAGLRAAVSIPEGGGQCLGKEQKPEACLAAASQLLLEVETYLRKQQGAK